MFHELNPPERILLGPGPSNAHPQVLKAMCSPLLGHLDPAFLQIMNQTMELLRNVFETDNKLTIPMSGTGSAGMETLFVNLIEPGDKALIGVAGLFGQRMVDVASRCGAEVTVIEVPWGEAIKPEQVAEAIIKENYKIVGLVHAETSTGIKQPLQEIAQIAHANGALFLVDAVTSLGGMPVQLDRIGIDACYSGTQKCLSAPPGLSPVTIGQQALEALNGRKRKVQSWYLDLTMISSYWGKERFYHHTAPISSIYALHEALRLLVEERLENVFNRHSLNGTALQKGLEAMGLELLVKEPENRLPNLTSVCIPAGIEDTTVRGRLLQDFGIEIGGGLGSLKGKIWRIGLMGHSCTKRNVFLVLSALEQILGDLGHQFEPGMAIKKAAEVYKELF